MPVTQKIFSVEDARRYARSSTPKALFNYIDGAAEGEVTAAANQRAFEDVKFRPRAGRGLPTPDQSTTVVGMPVSLPVIIAPCGLIQLLHPEGAVGVFRAAKRRGTIATLSTFAGTPPETLAAEPGPRWFQLYATDHDMAGDLIKRAKDSGYGALMLTMDSATSGKRERDAGTGAQGAMELNFKNVMRLAPQVIVRPRWGVRMVTTSVNTLRHATLPGSGVTAPMGPARPGERPPPGTPFPVSPYTWDDVKWVRDQWDGPLIVKAVLTGEDAVSAVDAGADAVVVSNHGGRQLEGAPATLTVLPEVVDAVNGRAEVLLDSGVRRGSDVVKAIALGARAVLIGRAYCYGLAAAGEDGVARVLSIFRDDIARTMALMGCSSVHDLDRSWLQPL
jgi:isopentenyl diphosphate isomerase/L-lactate dehydrogenase-like FMN-dependent dehydrogenase